MNNTKGKERRDNKSRRLCLLHKKDKEYLSKFAVVPHAGTWIEIQFSIQYDLENSSFPTRERGLKLKKQRAIKTVCGRSPRGNVDWNDVISMSCNILHGRSPRGNVDWNMTEIAFCKRNLCRSPRGNVDWNCVYMLINCPNSVVPHAGTWIEMVVRRFEGCCTCRSPHGNADWNNKEEIKRCGIWGVLYAEQNRKNRKSQLILAFNRHWCYNERN